MIAHPIIIHSILVQRTEWMSAEINTHLHTVGCSGCAGAVGARFVVVRVPVGAAGARAAPVRGPREAPAAHADAEAQARARTTSTGERELLVQRAVVVAAVERAAPYAVQLAGRQHASAAHAREAVRVEHQRPKRRRLYS